MTDFIRTCRTCLYRNEHYMCLRYPQRVSIAPQHWCHEWYFSRERQDWVALQQGTLKPGEDPHAADVPPRGGV